MKILLDQELLILLCSPRGSNKITNLLEGDFNWDHLIQMSINYGLVQLLYANLINDYADKLPLEVRAKLKNIFTANVAHNMELTSEMLKILRLLRDVDIPAIPFKGPVLATSCYGSYFLRQYGDIDILVKSQDSFKVKELLIAQNFRLTEERGWQQSFIYNPKPEIEIDLHWELAPLHFPFRHPDFEKLWQRREVMELNIEKIDTFSTVDTLLILIVQIAKGGYEANESLAHICDLAHLLYQQKDLSWGKLLQEVQDFQLERAFYIGLNLAIDIFGTLLPPEVEKTLLEQNKKDPVIGIYVNQIKKRLFSNKKTSLIEAHFFRYLMKYGTAIKVYRHVYVIWQFFAFLIKDGITDINEKDRDFYTLPRKLSFLYHVIRPVRIIIQHGLRMA